MVAIPFNQNGGKKTIGINCPNKYKYDQGGSFFVRNDRQCFGAPRPFHNIIAMRLTNLYSGENFIPFALKLNHVPKKRRVITEEQFLLLESTFQQNPFPVKSTRSTLAKKLEMEIKSIRIWFQNRRAKEKRQSNGNVRDMVLPAMENTKQEKKSEEFGNYTIKRCSTAPQLAKIKLITHSKIDNPTQFNDPFMLSNMFMNRKLFQQAFVPQLNACKIILPMPCGLSPL